MSTPNTFACAFLYTLVYVFHLIGGNSIYLFKFSTVFGLNNFNDFIVEEKKTPTKIRINAKSQVKQKMFSSLKPLLTQTIARGAAPDDNSEKC